MVQHIQAIDTDLKALRFADLELLSQGCVEAPRARPSYRILSESASSSRTRILQKNLTGLGIRNGCEGAQGLQICSQAIALGIFDRRESRGIPIRPIEETR